MIVVKQAPVPIAFGTSIKYQTKFAFALQREADLVFSVRQRLIDVGKCKDVLGASASKIGWLSVSDRVSTTCTKCRLP